MRLLTALSLRLQSERPAVRDGAVRIRGEGRLRDGLPLSCGPATTDRWCGCGREILRGGNSGRWPTRCTICRDVPPPPYEDHNAAATVAIDPDGWPAEAPGIAVSRALRRTPEGQTENHTPKIEDMT